MSIGATLARRHLDGVVQHETRGGPEKRDFVYVAAIIDGTTHKVLAHPRSISMTSEFCVDVLNALQKAA